jgi:hypothetical protein
MPQTAFHLMVHIAQELDDLYPLGGSHPGVVLSIKFIGLFKRPRSFYPYLLHETLLCFDILYPKAAYGKRIARLVVVLYVAIGKIASSGQVKKLTLLAMTVFSALRHSLNDRSFASLRMTA